MNALSMSIPISAANAVGSSITYAACLLPGQAQVTHDIAAKKLSRCHWLGLPKHLKRYNKVSVEKALGAMAFHDSLHATDTPHWIERREDGVYVLWGEDASNCALMHGFTMDDFPVGTRIEG